MFIESFIKVFPHSDFNFKDEDSVNKNQTYVNQLLLLLLAIQL